MKSSRLNKKLSNPKNGLRVYSQEPYAEELLKIYESFNLETSTQSSFTNSNKDFEIGKRYYLKDIIPINNYSILCRVGNGDVIIDIKNEKKFLKSFEKTDEEFIENLKNNNDFKEFIIKNCPINIISIKPRLKATFVEDATICIKEEMLKEIKNPTRVWKAKIIKKNAGGYMVKVGNIEGFLPGSLASANIVKDFDELVGKEVNVMIDDYLHSSKMFVFSVKKYLSYILPQKIKELDLTKKYTGYVTGTSKFGIFIEFDEIFTGLMHISKMSPAMIDKFNNKEYKAGDSIEFYILDNTEKLILTDLDVNELRKEHEEKIEELKEFKYVIGKVVSSKEHGVLLKLGESRMGDILGFAPMTKNNNQKYEIGKNLKCKIVNVNNKYKITLKIEK